MANWFPINKKELEEVIDRFLSGKGKGDVHGLIVPHAGYEFSGKIAGGAFSLLKEKKGKVVIFGPSHYEGFRGIRTMTDVETPLGFIDIPENKFLKIRYEHSVINEIPFLQKLGIRKILPLVVGEINNGEAKKIAEQFLDDWIYIFSTDLSHFLTYDESVKEDKRTIEIIENLDIKNWRKIDACGKHPLLVMMHLCKLKGWKPKLIEYKNSGDVTGDKSSVVGYASFWF